jgi:hypothetical protein
LDSDRIVVDLLARLKTVKEFNTWSLAPKSLAESCPRGPGTELFRPMLAHRRLASLSLKLLN